MSSDPPNSGRPFLARWSQRKLASARGVDAAQVKVPQPVKTSQAAPAQPALAPARPEAAPAPALPPVEALTFDSDFAAFLAPEVDATLRQKALRKLFSDPRFNVMDGLDVYIDDYNKFEPIPLDLIAKLQHAKDVLDPPRTRVNAQGHVEDVPPEEDAIAANAAAAEPDVPQVPANDDGPIVADGVLEAAPTRLAASAAVQALPGPAQAADVAVPVRPASGEGAR